MADQLITSWILVSPFLIPMLLCTQPIFNIEEPEQWYSGHKFQTQDLIRNENQEIELVYTDGAFLRQKLSVHKVNLEHSVTVFAGLIKHKFFMT